MNMINPESKAETMFDDLNANHDTFIYLDSNGFKDHAFSLNSFDQLYAAGVHDQVCVSKNALSSLHEFTERNKGKWMLGYLTFDIKNEIENLRSQNPDHLEWPLLHFIVPKEVIKIRNGSAVTFSYEGDTTLAGKMTPVIQKTDADIHIRPRISKEQYIHKVNAIKQHIQQGDIYELTFCQEFLAEDVFIDPSLVFKEMQRISPAPFSCYFKSGNHYLLSSSPERFLCRRDNKLFSQPIKGTIKRGADKAEDEKLKKALFESEKERSENVMIVDLVRNDLSKLAKRGSVKVEELFGIYSFSTVHQMISTISCEQKEGISFTDIIRATFPMGSMTGAPKIRALELIEEFEESRRGLFSGAMGYIDPDGNFDLSVVIRSILYNRQNKYLSLSTGGAITGSSIALAEYDESVLKSKAMVTALKNVTGK